MDLTSIERVVFCGNCLGPDIRAVDIALSELVDICEVDVMPGLEPYSNQDWPIAKINKLYLKHSASNMNLHAVSNPYHFSLGNIELLGTSGDNILNMMQHYPFSSRFLDYMLQTLTHHHIAPTAPDSLNCAAFEDQDPFVLDRLPHVYFAGNAPAYESTLLQEGQCRVIAVPDMKKTGSCVLLDLNDL